MAWNGPEKSPNSPHSHRYTIADDDAVETLMGKLETSSAGRVNRGKLRLALTAAIDEFRSTDERERKAFFHGLLTGYAVALKADLKAERIGEPGP
jgi:hypothetical protein